MGGFIITLIMGVMIASSTFMYTYKTINSEQKISIAASQRSSAVDIAISGLHIAKDALIADKKWNDGEGMDSLNENNGKTFIMHSNALEKDINNISINDGTLNVKIFPLSNNEIYVLSIGKVGNSKSILATKFNITSSSNQTPVLYSGKSYVRGGKVCSYKFDEDTGKVENMTNPNFALYMDGNINWSPTIMMPNINDPQQEPEKDVKIFTNPSTGNIYVSGYKDIDKLYSIGNVYLKNGAEVDYIENTGDIFIDSTSSSTNQNPNSDYEYPEINTDLPLYSFNDTTDGLDYVCTNNISDCKVEVCVRRNWRGRCREYRYDYLPSSRCLIGSKNNPVSLPSGSYGSLTMKSGCGLDFTGDNYKIKNLSIINESDVTFSNINTVLETKNLNVGTSNSNSQNKLLLDPTDSNSFITIKSEEMNLGKGSNLICSNPKNCLIDVNNLTMSSNSNINRDPDLVPTVQGTVIARGVIDLKNSKIVGNVVAHEVNANGSMFCNVVDKNGDQQMAEDNFFNIIGDNTQGIPIFNEVLTIVCNNEVECINNLNFLNK